MKYEKWFLLHSCQYDDATFDNYLFEMHEEKTKRIKNKYIYTYIICGVVVVKLTVYVF